MNKHHLLLLPFLLALSPLLLFGGLLGEALSLLGLRFCGALDLLRNTLRLLFNALSLLGSCPCSLVCFAGALLCSLRPMERLRNQETARDQDCGEKCR